MFRYVYPVVLYRIIIEFGYVPYSEYKIKSYYYFQINRWDLKLLNEQIIKFPAEKREEAIQQSVELLNRKDFKKYKVIDLRINDKVVVE